MSTLTRPSPAAPRDPRDALDHRLNDVGWGLFLVLMGTLWLLPAGSAPEGAWLLGTGVILLGLNAVRLAREIPVHRVGVLLGVLAILAGVDMSADLGEPLLPAALVAAGVLIIVRPLFARHH